MTRSLKGLAHSCMKFTKNRLKINENIILKFDKGEQSQSYEKFRKNLKNAVEKSIGR